MLAGSDWPAAVESMDPWVGIEAMVSRADPRGKSLKNETFKQKNSGKKCCGALFDLEHCIRFAGMPSAMGNSLVQFLIWDFAIWYILSELHNTGSESPQG